MKKTEEKQQDAGISISREGRRHCLRHSTFSCILPCFSA